MRAKKTFERSLTCIAKVRLCGSDKCSSTSKTSSCRRFHGATCNSPRKLFINSVLHFRAFFTILYSPFFINSSPLFSLFDSPLISNPHNPILIFTSHSTRPQRCMLSSYSEAPVLCFISVKNHEQ